MNKLNFIYKATVSPIIKKFIDNSDILSAWQTIYGGKEDKDLLRIIYVSEEDLYKYSNGIKKEYHENGQIHREYHVNENGKKDGLFRRWRVNGQLDVECTYKNGKYNGLYRRWDDNGQLFEDYMYKDDKRDAVLYNEQHQMRIER